MEMSQQVVRVALEIRRAIWPCGESRQGLARRRVGASIEASELLCSVRSPVCSRPPDPRQRLDSTTIFATGLSPTQDTLTITGSGSRLTAAATRSRFIGRKRLEENTSGNVFGFEPRGLYPHTVHYFSLLVALGSRCIASLGSCNTAITLCANCTGNLRSQASKHCSQAEATRHISTHKHILYPFHISASARGDRTITFLHLSCLSGLLLPRLDSGIVRMASFYAALFLSSTSHCISLHA